MGKIKKIRIFLIIIVIAALIICICLLWRRQQTWPIRFHSELDAFFGADRWEYLSEETKKSHIYTVRHYSADAPAAEQEVPGAYHNWDIRFSNRNGEEEIWTITDHAMKINHSKNDFFSADRFSARQALTRELMEISFSVAEEKIHEELLQKLLPEQEADCLKVDLSYRGGNPPLELYDKLTEQSWFTADQASASDYLSSDLYDFYLWIHAHDYKVEKLTESEREHLMGSLGELEKILLDTYGEYADYEIYLDDEHTAQH
ncbi:MAG: hypothetical protein NC293_08305 [Roseburia sp.]|nr:hypothetical protein [Roseburia sp.]